VVWAFYFITGLLPDGKIKNLLAVNHARVTINTPLDGSDNQESILL